MIAADRVKPDRAAQVQACLATVMDPELDESVTELGFVSDVDLLPDGEVHVGFRLPTYWCAVNFAFLMADDMRQAVQRLPWVTRVQVHLHDHMYADTINDGVAKGAGFQAAFGGDAEGGLEGLRQTFLVKAFQRRQQALLQHLLDAGHTAAELVALDIGGLQDLAVDGDGRRLVERYLERRGVVVGASSGAAFVDATGALLAAEALPVYLRDLRRVSINTDFNGALCRGLLEVRDRELVAQAIHIVRRPLDRIGVT